jgi:hypothetical protein
MIRLSFCSIVQPVVGEHGVRHVRKRLKAAPQPVDAVRDDN